MRKSSIDVASSWELSTCFEPASAEILIFSFEQFFPNKPNVLGFLYSYDIWNNFIHDGQGDDNQGSLFLLAKILNLSNKQH